MADLTITAASVVKGSNAVTETGTAGESVTAGQAVYKDPTTSKFLKADSDSATAAVRNAYGVALHAAGNLQPLTVQKKGQITIGATVAAGVPYYVSNTAGGICPVGDLGTGDYPCQIGFGVSTTVIDIDIKNPGVALA